MGLVTEVGSVTLFKVSGHDFGIVDVLESGLGTECERDDGVWLVSNEKEHG